jgi:hypothetical protein
MRRLKSSVAYMALSTFGVLLALCIPAAQAGASVPSTWHLGQVNIAELGNSVEYTSSGTVSLAFPINGGSAELTGCSATGSGTLSEKSSLTLKGCKTYWNGSRLASCDPITSIVINLSATMQSEKFWLHFNEEECAAIAPEIEVLAGQMNLEAGEEAFALPATIKEETTFGTHPGSINGSLTLSLSGSYKGKSFGAGPAPLVHLNGKTFAELGIAEESFTSKGSLKIELSGMFTLECSEQGEGTLGARGNALELVHLTNCVVVTNKTCHADPFAFWLEKSFEGTDKMTTIRLTGCYIEGAYELPNPVGYLHYGSEGKPLAVSMYASTKFGTHAVIISGSTQWYPAGSHWTDPLGIW